MIDRMRRSGSWVARRRYQSPRAEGQTYTRKASVGNLADGEEHFRCSPL